MIYADFEGILVSEDNGKENSEDSCLKKNKKTCFLHIWL